MLIIIRASLFALLVSLAIGFTACNFSPSKRNTHNCDTPEKVVQAYLVAMAAADQTQIQTLLAPERDVTTALSEKMELYGGIELENVRLEYQPTESSHFFIVHLYADDIQLHGQPQVVKDTLYVEFQKDCWFLVLGTPSGIPPVSDPPAQYVP